MAFNNEVVGILADPVDIRSYEPATGALLWSAPMGDVDSEIAIARAGCGAWAGRAIANRTETLRRFGNVLRGRHAALTDLLARETGKPLWAAQDEVDAALNKVDLSIAAYGARAATRRFDGDLGVRTAVRHKPHGILGVLGAHSFPLLQPLHHILPALIAGNNIVFKPSEKTPAIGAALIDCLHAAELPAASARLLIGDAGVGRALARHPGIDGLLFTGRWDVGRELHRLYGEMPNKVLALDMGGNNPIIAWDVADAPQAAMMIVQSAFASAGQSCLAARRLIVEVSKAQPLIDEISKLMERLIIGDPHSKPAPFMGSLIDMAAADHLLEAYLDLMMRGGRPIRHMGRPVSDRPFLTPGLIDVTDVDNRQDVEYYGPLLQVIRVPDFEAALTEANATQFGLCASLIGGSPALYERFWAEMRTGVANWNRPTYDVVMNAPLGGVGLSGNHRPGGSYAADYCAYPVVSTEVENVRALINVGLR